MTKSKIFFYSCLFFILGVGIASYLPLPLWAAFAILIAGCGFLFFSCPPNHPQPLLGKEGVNRRKIFIIIGLAGIFLFFGILRYEASLIPQSENQISFYNGQEQTFVGIVAAEPDVRDDGVKLKVKSERLKNPSLTLPLEKGEKIEGRDAAGIHALFDLARPTSLGTCPTSFQFLLSSPHPPDGLCYQIADDFRRLVPTEHDES